MADALMNRQPQIGRMNHQVPLPRLDRFGFQFPARLFSRLARFPYQVVFTHVLVTTPARGGQTVPRGKAARIFIDGRNDKSRIAADPRLKKEAAMARGEIFLFLDETHARTAEV